MSIYLEVKQGVIQDIIAQYQEDILVLVITVQRFPVLSTQSCDGQQNIVSLALIYFSARLNRLPFSLGI